MKAREDGTRGELRPMLGVPLSQQELLVLQLRSQGLTYHEIADQLARAEGTIKSQMAHVLTKLGARNTPHAVTIAKNRDLI